MYESTHLIRQTSPGDFYVFGPIKNDLGTVHYSNDDEVKNATLQWFNQIGWNFFDIGIEILVLCYDKCLNKFGYYIEKEKNVYISIEKEFFTLYLLIFFKAL